MTRINDNEWETVELGGLLVDIQPGFPSGEHNSEAQGVPHFRPMNVSREGRISRDVLKYVAPSAGRADLRLRRGDVLFNNTNSPELVGKTALFDDDDAPAFSNHMTRVRADTTRIDAGYLALRLHQAWREGYFARHCNNHVSQASIGREVLKNLVIELPPLETQRSIVRAYRSFDGLRSSTAEHVTASRRAVQRLHSSVVSSGCTGRLTETWRLTLAPEVTAAEDYARIRRLRASAARKAPLEPHLDEGLPDLPDHWQWASADALTTVITKGTTPSAENMQQGSGEVPYLKVYNLTFDGRVDFTINPTFVPHTVHDNALKRSRVFPGDLLINIVGPPLGKVGVVPDTHPEWNINQAIAVFRLLPGVNADFLRLWLMSPQALSHFVRRAKATAGQYNLTLEVCRELPVPVAPHAEQAEIVRRVKKLLESAAVAARGVDNASDRLERTSQAVLGKAFRGELLTQAVEPASR